MDTTKTETVTGFAVVVERTALRLLGRAEGDYTAARGLAMDAYGRTSAAEREGVSYLDVLGCLDALQARSEAL